MPGSYPNHEAGWLTASSVRKRNRQNEREKNKKAKLAEGEQEDPADAESVVQEVVQPTTSSLMTGYVRVPQVSELNRREDWPAIDRDGHPFLSETILPSASTCQRLYRSQLAIVRPVMDSPSTVRN